MNNAERYRPLVKSANPINNCWPGFRLPMLKDFGLILQKCCQDFQDLHFMMMDKNFDLRRSFQF